MNVYILKTTWSRVFVLLFLFATIFDMQGNLGLRYSVWSGVLIYSIFVLSVSKIQFSHFLFWFLIFFALPLASAVHGYLSIGRISVFLYLTPFMIPPMIYAFSKKVPVNVMIDYFFGLLLSLALVVLATNILVLIDSSVLYMVITNNFYANIDYYEGTRASALIPKVYHQATLFFAGAAIFYLVKKKFLLVLILFVAMALSASKGAVLVFLVFSVIYGVFCFSFLWKIRVAVVICTAFFIAISFQPALIENLSSTVLLENHTTSKRLLQIESMLELFSSNPLWLLVGQGLGTSFYSAGDNAYVTNAELDHLETLRRYGLVWCMCFFAAAFYASIRLIVSRNRDLQALGVSLIVAFFACGTNPVLISSVFFVLFTLSLLSLKNAKGVSLNEQKRLNDSADS